MDSQVSLAQNSRKTTKLMYEHCVETSPPRIIKKPAICKNSVFLKSP